VADQTAPPELSGAEFQRIYGPADPLSPAQARDLFAARMMRDKDRVDFDGLVTRLDPADRGWLRAALETVHPGHQWIGRLAG
jgi:hypothetical protein